MKSAEHASNCTTAEAGQADEHGIYVQALLLLVMITSAINLHHYLHYKNFKYLSESALYVLMGFIVSAGWTSISYDPGNSAIQLNSHFFSLVLLPPIIFEGGYNLQRAAFFQNIVPILGLALVGAFYSTFVTSFLMYIFSRLLTDEGWSVIECLVFGSLISSTDPVTVLSLLPSNVDRRLYMIIFGESALNDAVSIILYRFFTGLQADADNLGILPFFLSVLASFGVFLGSFLVGAIVALVFAKITKHVWIEGYEGAIYEIMMLIMFAYTSYLLAEVLSLTGIISIFFCGIVMAHYAHSNLTKLTQRTLKVTLRMICMVFEGLIFLYMGLGLLSFGTEYNILFTIAALIAILVSRTHVFIICSLNQFMPAGFKIPFNQQVLMWFSGLRGAVAFALGVTFLEHPDFSPVIKGLIFGTTVSVIVTTVLGFGGLMPYMLKWLGIAGGEEEHPHQPLASSHAQLDKPPEEEEYQVTEQDLEQPLFGWLYRFDVKYIRPLFTHPDEEQLKAIEVVRRRDSRTSTTGSAFPMTPLKDKSRASVRDDQEQLLKSNAVEDKDEGVPLEAVSLN
ncbi:Sodium/hydrogen exchanger family-domain-containing protein [Gorgonomyces haynaldii]|nr:Sodium/hydrogen exchanger family-domain-containing protein [Gorgonomyces haynaldii]